MAAAAGPVPVVEPQLLARAFDLLAAEAARGRKAKLDPRSAAVRAWLERGDQPEPDAAGLGALVRRLSALGEMLERIEQGSQALEVLVEAAAEATLVEQDGRPLFQPLDFHARAMRIAGLHAARGCSCCA